MMRTFEHEHSIGDRVFLVELDMRPLLNAMEERWRASGIEGHALPRLTEADEDALVRVLDLTELDEDGDPVVPSPPLTEAETTGAKRASVLAWHEAAQAADEAAYERRMEGP